MRARTAILPVQTHGEMWQKEEGEMYEDWPTLAEVVQRTGISERTLHRKIQAGELRREYRRIPNRKPVSILDPQNVAELEQTILHPIPTDTLPATVPPHTDMAALLAGLGITGVSLDKKIYLSIVEAAQLSGLPKAYLQRCIKDGTLPAKNLGGPAGWRIRRSDLETL
jgi:excisionase family DNA binding protein